MFQRHEEYLLRRTYFMEMPFLQNECYIEAQVLRTKKLTIRDSATCYLCDSAQVTSLPHDSVFSPMRLG